MRIAAYRRLDEIFNHESVDHATGQYVVGAVHTGTIEGFWSLLKRGIMGSFHKVSRKYLPCTSRNSSSDTTTGTTRTSSGQP